MSNLENLTKKILDDAKTSADEILAKVKIENEALVNDKILVAEKIAIKIVDKAIIEAEMEKNRVISNSKLEIRDQKLLAKQEVINRAVLLAKDRLNNINEEDYIKFLKNTLKNLNLDGKETLVVTEKFRNKAKNSDFKNKVSETRTVESGFLIEDGNTVMNYTFDSLVDYLKEELEGNIVQVLFRE